MVMDRWSATTTVGQEYETELAATRETALANLPKTANAGFAWVGITGLHAEVAKGPPIVNDQPTLRIVAVPTEGRHFLAGRAISLQKDQVYRFIAWVKTFSKVQVQIELTDGVKSADGNLANYGSAVFDPATNNVVKSFGALRERGIERGSYDWQKVWVDMPTTSSEQLDFGIGLLMGNTNTFKGDGRFGLILGGIEIVRH